jgi:hypothetical protein
MGVTYVASDPIDVGRTDYVTREEELNTRLYRINLLRSSDKRGIWKTPTNQTWALRSRLPA